MGPALQITWFNPSFFAQVKLWLERDKEIKPIITSLTEICLDQI
jgi:hypothetical protein